MEQILGGTPVAAPAGDRVAVLFGGLGSLATTAIACCHLLLKGQPLELSSPLRQSLAATPALSRVRSLVDAAKAFGFTSPSNLVFGGWNITPENAFEMASVLEVIPANLLQSIQAEMKQVRPMPAVFFPEQTPGLWNSHVKEAKHKAELAESVARDIEDFKRQHRCRRAVVVWTGTREVLPPAGLSHASAAAFRTALRGADASISASQIYAAAAFQTDAAFVAGGASRTVSFPAFRDLALARATPYAGEDFAVPFMESFLAGAQPPIPPERNPQLTVTGPAGGAFQGELVESSTFPAGPRPRRESRLTAPSVLETALWLDLVNRRGDGGPQQWLNVYFSRPVAPLEPGRDYPAFHSQILKFAAGPVA
ncbi:MAG: inositol-3-phosphate synthase [Bryobacterales bacterium]|nr:inositol-3-phosphate synthase [Bryobacterales bacterium]